MFYLIEDPKKHLAKGRDTLYAMLNEDSKLRDKVSNLVRASIEVLEVTEEEQPAKTDSSEEDEY